LKEQGKALRQSSKNSLAAREAWDLVAQAKENLV